jgi:hypothetical protein
MVWLYFLVLNYGMVWSCFIAVFKGCMVWNYFIVMRVLIIAAGDDWMGVLFWNCIFSAYLPNKNTILGQYQH